jgi:outer membrane protein assembly factor BamB
MSRPVIGADGTIYVNDANSHLYALTPDGELKWVLNGAGDAGVDIGPDGTIYVGSTVYITAVRPDGTVKWRFQQQPEAFILLGPSVGPDGNIYAVASSGMGVFSLTPKGKVRWTVPEAYDRLIVENQELAFGPAPGGGTQLYFHANKHFEAVTLQGKITFSIHGDGNDPCGGGQPVVGPNGNAYTTNWQIGEGEKLGSYSPSGKRNWTFVYQPNNCQSNPDVAPNGKVYIVWNNSRLFSVSPKGQAKEIALDFESGLQNPAVSPVGGQVLVTGGGQGRPGVFESFQARNGRLLWKITLPDEDGANVVPMSAIGPRFAPDGETAYMTAIVSGVYDHCYLYAIDTHR